MVLHATQKEQDKAREEWFATMDERRIAREMQDRKKLEQERFHKEWWDIKDSGKSKLEGQAKKC